MGPGHPHKKERRRWRCRLHSHTHAQSLFARSGRSHSGAASFVFSFLHCANSIKIQAVTRLERPLKPIMQPLTRKLPPGILFHRLSEHTGLRSNEIIWPHTTNVTILCSLSLSRCVHTLLRLLHQFCEARPYKDPPPTLSPASLSQPASLSPWRRGQLARAEEMETEKRDAAAAAVV